MLNSFIVKNEKKLTGLIATSVFFVLIYNIIFYNPIEGYDAEAHYNYVDYFAMYLPDNIKFPSNTDSREFFNPPLPYLFPSFVQVLCRNLIQTENLALECREYYGLYTQIFQSILYLISLFINFKTIQTLFSKKRISVLSFILVFSIMTINYKAISMIRGEIYIVFFMSFLLYIFVKLTKQEFKYSKKEIFFFGIIIAGLALSRQWAFLLFPSFFIIPFFIKNKLLRSRYFKFISYSFLVGFIFSSWFYIHLFLEYGSFTAFNKPPVSFSLKNQNIYFYLPISVESLMVFSKPIRPYFSNQFLPILYSDFWGDYWGYFSFTSRSLDTGRNQLLIGDYLARVNIVSLVPSFMLIYSLFFAKKTIKESDTENCNIFLRYIYYAFIISIVGYLWFLIKYPELPTGDTNKATHMIHAFHILGILSVFLIEKIKEKNYSRYSTIVTALIFVFFHNISAMMSHF